MQAVYKNMSPANAAYLVLPNKTTCLHDITTSTSYDLTFVTWGRSDGGSFSYSESAVRLM